MFAAKKNKELKGNGGRAAVLLVDMSGESWAGAWVNNDGARPKTDRPWLSSLIPGRAHNHWAQGSGPAGGLCSSLPAA